MTSNEGARFPGRCIPIIDAPAIDGVAIGLEHERFGHVCGPQPTRELPGIIEEHRELDIVFFGESGGLRARDGGAGHHAGEFNSVCPLLCREAIQFGNVALRNRALRSEEHKDDGFRAARLAKLMHATAHIGHTPDTKKIVRWFRRDTKQRNAREDRNVPTLLHTVWCIFGQATVFRES